LHPRLTQYCRKPNCGFTGYRSRGRERVGRLRNSCIALRGSGWLPIERFSGSLAKAVAPCRRHVGSSDMPTRTEPCCERSACTFRRPMLRRRSSFSPKTACALSPPALPLAFSVARDLFIRENLGGEGGDDAEQREGTNVKSQMAVRQTKRLTDFATEGPLRNTVST
jgi:hypothetical protein